MKTKLSILGTLFGIALLVIACARPNLPHATTADALRASSTWPGTTTAQLDHGRSLYLSRCTSCHLPVEPSRIAAAEWPEHVNEMKERAHLDEEEASLVIRYLVTMADEQHAGSR